MERCLRLLVTFMCAFYGVAVASQEVVVFADFRSLIVQSHRVDGSWTYLKVGSGEMAVPSASVLGFAAEKTTGAPLANPSALSRPSASPPASPAVSAPRPWRPEPPPVVRPPDPVPEPQMNQDDEEDSEDEMDEEEKEPDIEPPPGPPEQPGNMPPQPHAPNPFQKPQEPGESKG